MIDYKELGLASTLESWKHKVCSGPVKKECKAPPGALLLRAPVWLGFDMTKSGNMEHLTRPFGIERDLNMLDFGDVIEGDDT